ncbi:unnamed protein product [Rotaria socialis]|uniref:Ferric-chelate reductase 1 n=1 Tax=Rotaria socialis TaxID=392032 RepID=A0A820Y372_9BILA|nr:unnamed protein product [Rotaria socialis]CAF4543704.1 unnamed protein product [Rotaria socialis]
MPQLHGAAVSSCSSGYMITTATDSYAVGDAIHVVVRGISSDTTFRGILLFAKDSNNTIVGSWTTNDLFVRNVSCGGVIHNSQVDKNSVEAVFHVPPNLVGNIEIQATIAETESIIFINCYKVTLTSRVVNELVTTISPLTSEPLNTTATILPSSTTTSNPPPNNHISVNVSWTFDSENVTRAHMAITNLMSAEWAAIALTQRDDMGEAHVFICRRLANDTVDVNRYINPSGHAHPVLAGSEQGGTFTAEQQIFENGVVYCQFTLSNFTTSLRKEVDGIRKLSQSTRYHPMFAIGQLDSSNELKQHAGNARTVQSRFVQLSRAETIEFNVTRLKKKSILVQAHGSILVFTWILIVSTGILFARYFKNSWSNNLICDKAVWYTVHLTLMSASAILTVLGFMFIFVYNKGGWVKEKEEFAHAIVGVIVVGLAFFQPFIALFRCEPSSPYRFFFNYLHAFVGFVAFILSITAIVLATIYFTSIFLDNTAWIIMIVWACWVIAIFIAFEYVQRKVDSSKSSSLDKTQSSDTSDSMTKESGMPSFPLLINRNDEQLTNFRQQRLKNILLGLHALIAIGISVTLVVLIFQTD